MAASEIESMLETIAGVQQAIVVPVPHPILNEVPAALWC